MDFWGTYPWQWRFPKPRVRRITFADATDVTFMLSQHLCGGWSPMQKFGLSLGCSFLRLSAPSLSRKSTLYTMKREVYFQSPSQRFFVPPPSSPCRWTFRSHGSISSYRVCYGLRFVLMKLLVGPRKDRRRNMFVLRHLSVIFFLSAWQFLEPSDGICDKRFVKPKIWDSWNFSGGTGTYNDCFSLWVLFYHV